MSKLYFSPKIELTYYDSADAVLVSLKDHLTEDIFDGFLPMSPTQNKEKGDEEE